MANKEASYLHLYCICGQKMRVTEDMYGRPGKCVACRQKIRIPRADELPAGATAIHLKDHPELLRKAKRTVRRAERAEEAAEAQPTAADREEAAAGVPLDVLEPLRALASLEHKVRCLIDTLPEPPKESPDVENEAERAKLASYLRQVKALRTELDEDLRRRLMEVAIELTSTQEKIADTRLAVRVGEIDFATYRQQVTKLCFRRDSLERRQENLRGWLAVRDPHIAGGYIDIPFDRIPKAHTRVTLPAEPAWHPSLLESHVESLREALLRRAEAERALDALGRAGNMRGASLALRNRYEDAQAERQRVAAAVAFYRGRLKQLQNDLAADIQAIESQLDLAQARLRAGELTRPSFDRLEQELLGAKTDFIKASDVAARALSANAAQDVPGTQKTFLERIVEGAEGPRIPSDAWAAWASAVLMLLSLFLSVGQDMTPLGAWRRFGNVTGDAYWLVLVPVATALCVAGAAWIPRAGMRVLMFGALGVAASTVTGFCLSESRYSLSPVGECLRQGALPLLFRPAIGLFVLGLLGTMSAALLALAVSTKSRSALVGTAMGILVSFAGGAFAGSLAWSGTSLPAISEPERKPAPTKEGVYETTIEVTNPGKRPLLLSTSSTAHNAYVYALEKQIGEESWLDVSTPRELKVAHAVQNIAGEEFPAVVIPAHATATLTYELGPGSYRVLLKPRASGVSVSKAFTLEPIVTPEPAEAAAQGSGTSPDNDVIEPNLSDAAPHPTPPGPAANTPTARNHVGNAQAPAIPADEAGPIVAVSKPAVDIELRGVLNAKDRDPRFAVTLFLADGSVVQRTLAIGSTVYGNWKLAEYNPGEQLIAFANGDKLHFLRSGERTTLPGGP